jgi:hypothetical protein
VKGKKMAIKDKREALTLALALAITATDQARMDECIEMAETIANSGMTLDEVIACKAAAQEMVGVA